MHTSHFTTPIGRRLRWTTLAIALATLTVASLVSAGVFEPTQLLVEQQQRQPAPGRVAPAPVPIADEAIEAIPGLPYREADPTFASYGLSVGDVGPEVVLYDMDGSHTSNADQGSPTRPTLFISVSLTCPIARAHMADAERVARQHGDLIDVRLVYVVEAHPVGDPSPYTGADWPSEENSALGILYRQPVTMGERIAHAEKLQSLHPVSIPMLVDGPSNPWWRSYGPAPNQAVLLAPDGEVLIEHGWFDGEGLDIDADLARQLQVGL